MKIVKKEERNIELIEQLVKVWRSSVEATHLFLTEEEIDNIQKYVTEGLMGISNLIIKENEEGEPIGFMGIEEDKLEMLFIEAKKRGHGIGKQFIEYGIKEYSVKELGVNEQNPEAKGFYEHMGFKVYKRTELDEQGMPYPILYMRLG